MKISILLPLKENFSPSYAGAVSLFINDTLKFSKFKKDITVFGNTEYKKKFNKKYNNIYTKKTFFQSRNKEYDANNNINGWKCCHVDTWGRQKYSCQSY